MSKQPAVTIGIPTYNRAPLLKEAIESVLRQSYKNITLIISDNGSKDDTKKLVEEFRQTSGEIEIIYSRFEETVPVFDNWKKVLDLAETPYFGWLQDDDLLRADFVENAVNELEKHKNATVYTCFAQFNPQPVTQHSMAVWGSPFSLNWAEEETFVLPGHSLIPIALYDGFGYSPVAMFDREVMMNCQEYLSKEYWLHNERMIMIHASLGNTIVFDSRIGGLFRSHPDQMSYVLNDKARIDKDHVLYLNDLQKLYDRLGDVVFEDFTACLEKVDLAKKVAWRKAAVPFKDVNSLSEKAFEKLHSHVQLEKKNNPSFVMKMRIQKMKKILLSPYHFVLKTLMKLSKS